MLVDFFDVSEHYYKDDCIIQQLQGLRGDADAANIGTNDDGENDYDNYDDYDEDDEPLQITEISIFILNASLLSQTKGHPSSSSTVSSISLDQYDDLNSTIVNDMYDTTDVDENDPVFGHSSTSSPTDRSTDDDHQPPSNYRFEPDFYTQAQQGAVDNNNEHHATKILLQDNSSVKKTSYSRNRWYSSFIFRRSPWATSSRNMLSNDASIRSNTVILDETDVTSFVDDFASYECKNIYNNTRYEYHYDDYCCTNNNYSHYENINMREVGENMICSKFRDQSFCSKVFSIMSFNGTST